MSTYTYITLTHNLAANGHTYLHVNSQAIWDTMHKCCDRILQFSAV